MTAARSSGARGALAAFAVLVGVACQLMVDLSQYTFSPTLTDGGVEPLEPANDFDGGALPPLSSGADLPAPPVRDAGRGPIATEPMSQGPEPEPTEPEPTEPEPTEPEPEPPLPEPEPEPEPPEPEPEPEPPLPEPEPEPEPPEPEPEPEPEPPAPEPDPQSGCSRVEFCNADQVDGSGDQERCQQTGCSVEDAIVECRQEVPVVCGNVQPPYVLVTLSEQRLVLN